MIKRLIVYLFILIVAMFVIRELLYIGIRKNQRGVFEKYTTIFLKSNNYDLLFLGSSRAETHFNTFLFDSLTKLNSYNLGVTGATPRITYAVLKAYCSKSKLPKYAVLDIDYHFLKYGVDTIRHFPRYFAYLENETLLQQFNAIDNRFKQFKMNPFYSLPYSNTRLLAASLHGWLGIEGKFDTTYYKGYTDVCFTDTLITDQLKPFYGFIHPTERKYVDSLINFSKTNNIQLLLITSPMYEAVTKEMQNKPRVISQLENIAKINHLNYYDFSLQTYSSRKAYFTDYYHMTGFGAKHFTRDFSVFFQQYFNKFSVK